MFNINRKKWIMIAVIAIVTVLIPILINVFEFITIDKESIVFLEGYPTSMSVLILLYYMLLIILCLALTINNASAQLCAQDDRFTNVEYFSNM
jgi:uncharacterized membrane protein